jgi:Fe2+ or Zn2+ uptake regulation protein
MIADSIPEVTVLFCELQLNFYEYAAEHIVTALNTVYSAFDELVDATGVHKVETVGEVYLCVGGCPKQSRHHAAQACIRTTVQPCIVVLMEI